MPIIDSRREKLPLPSVITQAMANADLKGVPPYAALLSIVQETSLPDCEVKQFGNTVFIGHRGKDKNKHAVVGRALNVDTAKNFIANGLEYFKHLQSSGVTDYYTWFDNPSFASAFKLFERYPISEDTRVDVTPTPSGKYNVHLHFGGESK